MTLTSMGCPAVSLTGRQAGFRTDVAYSKAKILTIDNHRVLEEFAKGNVVVVAGFQGVDERGEVHTLGRGGSDTSAVALAIALDAEMCEIYTDVNGVYTADPRKVQGAKKLDAITFDEMLELASLGAQVLHNRSVEMAKRYSVNLEVLSSYERKPGTIVKEVVKKMEQMKISGIAKDCNVTRIAIEGIPDEPGKAFKVFTILAKAKINVDIILQSVGKGHTNDISFTVAASDAKAAFEAIESYREVIGFERVSMDEDIAKISIVGAGMISSPGIAALMFEALSDAKINIKMISTSEIKVSVLIEEAMADTAVQAIHTKFFAG